jgi:hypothetical protein
MLDDHGKWFLAYVKEALPGRHGPDRQSRVEQEPYRIATGIETMVAERSVEALATSCAFKRRVQQISDQCCNQTSSAHHDK